MARAQNLIERFRSSRGYMRFLNVANGEQIRYEPIMQVNMALHQLEFAWEANESFAVINFPTYFQLNIYPWMLTHEPAPDDPMQYKIRVQQGVQRTTVVITMLDEDWSLVTFDFEHTPNRMTMTCLTKPRNLAQYNPSQVQIEYVIEYVTYHV